MSEEGCVKVSRGVPRPGPGHVHSAQGHREGGVFPEVGSQLAALWCMRPPPPARLLALLASIHAHSKRTHLGTWDRVPTGFSVLAEGVSWVWRGKGLLRTLDFTFLVPSKAHLVSTSTEQPRKGSCGRGGEGAVRPSQRGHLPGGGRPTWPGPTLCANAPGTPCSQPFKHR